MTDAPPDPTYWQGRARMETTWQVVWNPDRQRWRTDPTSSDRARGRTITLASALRTLCAPPSLEVRLRREAAAFRRLSEYHYRQAANPWLLDSTVKSRERDEGFRFASIAESLEGVLREHEAATSPATPE